MAETKMLRLKRDFDNETQEMRKKHKNDNNYENYSKEAT